MALASGPVALASKVQALRAALIIFFVISHSQTQGPTITAKVKLKDIVRKMILRTAALMFTFT